MLEMRRLKGETQNGENNYSAVASQDRAPPIGSSADNSQLHSHKRKPLNPSLRNQAQQPTTGQPFSIQTVLARAFLDM
jgi:hypothetical protein